MRVEILRDGASAVIEDVTTWDVPGANKYLQIGTKDKYPYSDTKQGLDWFQIYVWHGERPLSKEQTTVVRVHDAFWSLTDTTIACVEGVERFGLAFVGTRPVIKCSCQELYCREDLVPSSEIPVRMPQMLITAMSRVSGMWRKSKHTGR